MVLLYIFGKSDVVLATSLKIKRNKAYMENARLKDSSGDNMDPQRKYATRVVKIKRTVDRVMMNFWLLEIIDDEESA